jgi:hypothetical protein
MSQKRRVRAEHVCASEVKWSEPEKSASNSSPPTWPPYLLIFVLVKRCTRGPSLTFSVLKSDLLTFLPFVWVKKASKDSESHSLSSDVTSWLSHLCPSERRHQRVRPHILCPPTWPSHLCPGERRHHRTQSHILCPPTWPSSFLAIYKSELIPQLLPAANCLLSAGHLVQSCFMFRFQSGNFKITL